MRGTSGNEALIGRVKLVSGHEVPVITGNSLRHRCIRGPIGSHLVSVCGLAGKLTTPQLAFLFNGGALTESTGREDTRRIAKLREISPGLGMLGGSLPDQIISGQLQTLFGTLVCEETRSVLEATLPQEWPLPSERLRPAESMVSQYLYTRGRSATTVPHLVAEDEAAVVVAQRSQPSDAEPVARGRLKDDKSTQMLFTGQQVSIGAAFVHGFVLPSGTELQLGAILMALRDWQQSGGTVGGGACRGQGRLKTYVHVNESPQSISSLIAAYEEHVQANAEAFTDWLMSAFAEKAAGGKKGKKAAAE